MKRRDFLRGAGLVSAGCVLSQLGAMRALADGSGGYKALVCIFLNGGNDSNNTVVPLDSTQFARYMKTRGVLTLSKDSLAPLTLADGSAPFGLHPSLAGLVPAWESEQLALLFNVGMLQRPLTVAEYRTGTNGIPGLFSHADQVRQWQCAVAGTGAPTGWGGRVMDVMSADAGAMPGLLSVSGASRFGMGVKAEALVVPNSGLLELSGEDGTPAADARMSAWMKLHAVDKDSQLIAAAQDVSSFTLEKRETVNALLATSAPVTKTAFAGLNSGIARQLAVASKLIEHRHLHGTRRQVFYASIGGFDTHASQLGKHTALLRDLGTALAAFNTALNGMGASSEVTTFTHSEFSRTLRANTSGGTDHAWGGHHLIMGGAVAGRAFHGVFPDLRTAGPDDADWLGRWVPTTSVDQYAATLARWFGVSAQHLPLVLPNLPKFAQPTLSFMRE